ncbi:MAG: hypothetical protein R3253_03805 [Longimicrobiales bacterium]|nr:hypothetical protein [Longimicrobiales bacterium]
MLRPAGRLAAVVIETGEALGAEELELAAELGPSQVRAEASLADMARRAGFRVDAVHDVTPAFQDTLMALWTGLHNAESELRSAEGDPEFDYEVGRRRSMLEAVRRGLIRRTSLVATRP